jgi:hypothetical protein
MHFRHTFNYKYYQKIQITIETGYAGTVEVDLVHMLLRQRKS